MRTVGTLIGMLLALVVAPDAVRAEDRPTQARSAVTKSLALLEHSAATYITRRMCYSCHHQSLPALAIAAARDRGLPVNATAARAQSVHAIDHFFALSEKMRQGTGVPGGPYTAGYGLVGLAADRWPADETTADMITYLFKTQQANGRWRQGTNRPPLEYSEFTSTALAVRGLALYASPNQKDEVTNRTERARQWLTDTTAKENEDKTYRLLGLMWSGADAALVRSAAHDLRRDQRDDGGWGQTPDLAADAYATGQALVALHWADALSPTDPAYQRGADYLLHNQLPDGSWVVQSRSKPFQTYFESGFPHNEAQWISICATSWATMALTYLLPEQPPGRTTLGGLDARYRVSDKPYIVLKRGGVEAVVVTNAAVDDAVLPGHRAGYNGIGSLKGAGRTANYFVPAVAGLNFEHIHDGTVQKREVLFEPRHAPMELRLIDEHTAELYQAPTPHYGLESCTRYRLLDDGAIEMTFECIPRRRTFTNGYIGLFWASYIHRPESLDVHFKGFADGEQPAAARWVRATSPKHGTDATHVAADDRRTFVHDPAFPLTLVFNRSKWRYAEPWYFGVNGGVALAQIFRPGDGVRLSQSPSGGGTGNPAWDFQMLIPDHEVGRRHQLVMRAALVPFESPEQVERATAVHRKALAADGR